MIAMSKPELTPARRPLYEQIKILLTNSLVAGEWKPGEAIPSEMELALLIKVGGRQAIVEAVARPGEDQVELGQGLQ